MSQGDIERKTGLLRCYISRVENGHTIPAIETLEKMARAVEIELYHLFFESNGHKKPQDLNLPVRPHGISTFVATKSCGAAIRVKPALLFANL